MGKRMKRAPKRETRKKAVSAKEKARKVTKTGKIKRKRGDEHLATSRNVGFKVKQKKGGQWVKASGDRECKIHTKCNCVVRTDPSKQRFIKNR